MMKQVIRCGALFDANRKEFEKHALIFINDKQVEKVSLNWEESTEGYTVVDLSEKYVLPGLIDCHVHTNLNGELNSMNYLGLEMSGEVTIKSLVHAQSDLIAGFTTIRDEGAVHFTDVAVKNSINRGLVGGPRMLVSGLAIGSTGGHADSAFNPYVTGDHAFGAIIDSPVEGRRAARYNFKYGADQVKLMATGGVMSAGDDPGAPELSFEEMKAVIDEANMKGKISSAHTHGALGIKNAIRAGVTSIEHGTMMDEEGLALLLEQGTYLVPTLSAGYLISKHGKQAGLPAFVVEKTEQVIESHFRSFSNAYQAGAKIAFGTDVGTPFDKHGKQAGEFALMVRAGMAPADAIAAATKVAAELLRWDQKIGTIEAGKFADMIAVDQNPLDDITELERVRFVMKDGTIYKS